MTAQLWTNCNAATMQPGGLSYGLIEDAVLVVEAESIAWVGPRTSLPPELLPFARLSTTQAVRSSPPD